MTSKGVYEGSVVLEKAYDTVNKEFLWQELRMFDVSGKLLSGIKNMYFNSLVCLRVKGCESECFRIDSGVRQGFIMFTWLFNIYMDTVRKGVKMWMRRMG